MVIRRARSIWSRLGLPFVFLPTMGSAMAVAGEPTPSILDRLTDSGAPIEPSSQPWMFGRIVFDSTAQSGAQERATDASPSEKEAGAEGLAKKLQNPIADLISLPFQSNFEYNVGPDNDGFRYTLNIQPVIPFSLDEDWKVISRTILPVTYQDDVFGDTDQFGLGDTLQSLFFSPKATIHPVWGAGPAFLVPTATDDLLGGEKWGAGPTAVVLQQEGPWTGGVLANHIWSFAGDDDRPRVNSTFLQPFLAYTFPHATTIGANTESTYDWTEHQWTVPLQLLVSQVLKVGDQPVSFGLAGRYWTDGPDRSPEWGFRFIITFLFP